MVAIEQHTLSFEVAGPWEEKDGVFRFQAKSISTDEICEEMMDILLEQVPGQPLIFRHRHPAGNDDKVVPIFGRMKSGKKMKEENKTFLVIDYEVQLVNKNKKELSHKKLFVDWVKASYEEKKPVGISLAYLLYKEGGKAYWADLFEGSGTHVPACKECTHIEKNEGVSMSLNEKDIQEKPQVGKKTYLELEKDLEKLTKEKADVETSLQQKIASVSDEKKKLQEGYEGKLDKLNLEVARLSKEFEYAKTKAPLVKQLLELEKRPELEVFYKEQTTEYLEKHLKELIKPKPVLSQPNSFAMKFEAAQTAPLDTGDITEEDLKNVDPSIKAEMKEWLAKKKGM